MLPRYLPASLLTTALVATGLTAPLQAGRVAHAHAHHPPPHATPHHRFMMPGPQAEDRARLGVAIAAISQDDLDRMGLEYGVRVEAVVPGSVAAEAGLADGDVVTHVDGRPAYSPERLQHLVRAAAGATDIALHRGGEPVTLQATFSPAASSATRGRAVLGIRIQEMTQDLKEAFGAVGERGVLIAQVADGGAAKAAGLRAGDVVVGIGGADITTVDDVHATLGDYSPGDTLDVSILRDRREMDVKVAVGGPSVAPPPRAAHPHGMHGHGHHESPGPHGTPPRPGCRMGKALRPS